MLFEQNFYDNDRIDFANVPKDRVTITVTEDKYGHAEELQKQVENLRDSVRRHSKTIDSLEAENRTLAAEVQHLKEYRADLEAEGEAMKGELRGLRKKFSNDVLNLKIADLEKLLKQRDIDRDFWMKKYDEASTEKQVWKNQYESLSSTVCKATNVLAGVDAA